MGAANTAAVSVRVLPKSVHVVPSAEIWYLPLLVRSLAVPAPVMATPLKVWPLSASVKLAANKVCTLTAWPVTMALVVLVVLLTLRAVSTNTLAPLRVSCI